MLYVVDRCNLYHYVIIFLLLLIILTRILIITFNCIDTKQLMDSGSGNTTTTVTVTDYSSRVPLLKTNTVAISPRNSNLSTATPEDDYENKSISAVTIESASRNSHVTKSKSMNDDVMFSNPTTIVSSRFSVVGLSQASLESDVDAFIGRLSSTQVGAFGFCLFVSIFVVFSLSIMLFCVVYICLCNIMCIH